MEKTIARATHSINQILESSSQALPSFINCQLANIIQLLNRLLESDSSRNKETQLFCRQLNRLMDYNESLSEEFWIELENDILLMLEESDGKQGLDSSRNRFFERINFEKELEQRESQFQKTFGERKSIHQIFFEHKKFFQEYLDKCISLHLKVVVQGLVENIDDLLYRVYKLNEVSFSPEGRKRLEEKLKCIEITLDSSNISLNILDFQSSTDDNSYKRINDSLHNFLPSLEQKGMNQEVPQINITNILRLDRWVVILGGPGCAKTTLLRWLTRIFAETAHKNHEEFVLNEDNRVPVRIPILIRIGEFASWLDQHQTKTLMDYIGDHTWFSERYCHDDDDDKSVLKELINHGHALILLDGLDEIIEVGQRQKIVDLVREFINEHVRAPDFISAFDDTSFNKTMFSYKTNLIEAQSPNISGGNQIVVTSRIVGYQQYPLNGSFINHYSLGSMYHREAKKFVKMWISTVEERILDILSNEEIKPDKEIVETTSLKRNNFVESMFETDSKLLMSNPLLLSLICTFIFYSSDEFHLKTRVEVYTHAVQAALHSWRRHKSNISESVLTYFLSNLAIYLHLNSPSGLIDAFDMERLCGLTLKQQGVSNDRTELRKNANELISVLDSNIGIVAERGLQVFGFLHLSFQEYLIAQSLVKGSPDEVVQRVLTFTIHPRSHESLALALGWISWKWSFDNYDQFCHLLMTSTKDYAIPLGTLLFFGALNDLQRLPSNWIIFIALNNLLHHPSNVIRRTYLILHLSKLPKNIITEWMQSYLKDDQCLFKFCQSFLMHREKYSGWKSLSSLVCQQLWSFRDRNSSAEFIIDQTLRRTMTSIDVDEQIFNKDLSSYLLKNNICIFNIHPLIVSIIIAVCGGICLTEENNVIKINFSPKRMHRESLILKPIIEYLTNKEESHSIKVQTLVKRYESVLQQSSSSDTSVHMVDSFIALICLQGLSQPLIYQKYDGYQALPLALERLKRTWFYFKELCDSFQCRDYQQFDISFIQSEVETIMNAFFSQTDQSDEQRTSFSVACASAWKKLGIWNLSNTLNCDVSHGNKISRFFQYQTDFINSINKEKLDETVKNIHSVQILQQEPCHLLVCVPQSLHQLYHLTTFSSPNNIDSLPPIVFLSYLEDADINDLYFALTMLHPLSPKDKIENYSLLLLLLWEKCSYNGLLDHNIEEFFKKMKVHELFDPVLEDQKNYLEKFINIEHQRISEAEKMDTCQEKDSRLFAASISLTRLVQARHNSRKYQTTKDIGLLPVESKKVCSSIINIDNPILRIIALSTILNIKNLVVFDEEQRDKFRREMIDLLQSQLPQLPLLRATFLFVRCYSACQFFPENFLQMSNIIATKFKENSIVGQRQSQEAAYIALRQLNNSNLSNCLSEFAKQTTNLSDLLRFNSTTFFRYFTNTTSFDSSNTILLSSMYLAELTFDAQILKMYIRDDLKNNISNMKELEQLWNDSPIYPKTMTYKIATWIANNLKILNKQELDQIIEDVSDCVMIEKKALSVIKEWLNYRTDKNFSFFALYAALQLIIEGSDIPDLTDIINKMFDIDSEFRLKLIVNHLLSSQFANQIIVRQILITLHGDVRHSSQISVWIDRIEMLELILNLELKRITSNVRRSPSTNSFLSMFFGFSKDFQAYLVKYLHDYINEHSELENAIKHEYVARIIKWIIENSIWYETKDDFLTELYDYIFTLLYDSQSPQVQKAIVSGINSVFMNPRASGTNGFMQSNTITNLGKVLHSWDKYPEDVLSVFLLAYGNRIIILRLSKWSPKVVDKIMDTLTYLHETSSSEVISIRAGFCLVLVQQSSVTINTILDWFRSKPNMTPQKTYKMLLQLTLYKEIYALYDSNIGESEFFEDTIDKEVIDHLETHCIELMDMFVIDLYNYLGNKHQNDNLADPEPDYIKIVLKISEKHFNKFRNALQKSSFGEENFKNQLYNCYKNNPKDSKALIEFYLKFGILTFELVEMLQLIEDDSINNIKFNENCIEEVSDRDVIEKLFELLDSNIHHNKFRILLLILKSLVMVNVISLLEVYQWFSRINNISSDDDNKWWNNEREFFNWLLNVGGFDGGYLWKVEQIFFKQSDIDEEFQREIMDLEKRTVLFRQGNAHPTDSLALF